MQNKKSTSLTINQHIMDIIRKESPETVEQLVKLVRLRYPIPEHEIMKHILHLQKQGQLALREHTAQLPRTVEGYLLTKQAAWFWAIIALALTTTILVFIIPEDAYPSFTRDTRSDPSSSYGCQATPSSRHYSRPKSSTTSNASH